MTFDPIAALHPCAVDIQLGGWEYTIPALSAARWIEAVLDPDGLAIVPGLLGIEDRRDVLGQWVTGAFSPEEIAETARAALGAAAGRPWWQAAKLIYSACDERAWPIISGTFARGTDLDKIGIGAFCNAVWALAMRNADEQERARLEAEMSIPPAGVDLDELLDEEAEAEAFAADLAEYTGSLGGTAG